MGKTKKNGCQKEGRQNYNGANSNTPKKEKGIDFWADFCKNVIPLVVSGVGLFLKAISEYRELKK